MGFHCPAYSKQPRRRRRYCSSSTAASLSRTPSPTILSMRRTLWCSSGPSNRCVRSRRVWPDLMPTLDPRRGLDAYRRIRRGGNVGASPPTLLAAGFLALILLGTLLLLLPFAAKDQGLTLFEAFFTATAVVTVTGLSIVDTQQLSLYGQCVTILLVQI